MFIRKNHLSIKQCKELEIAAARIEIQTALLEFVAIMADVELPEDKNTTSEIEED